MSEKADSRKYTSDNDKIQADIEKLNMKMGSQQQLKKLVVDLPPFWTDMPDVWFAHVETLFDLAGIISDGMRFSYVVGYLDRDLAFEVADLILNPPSEGKYAKLKKQLIESLNRLRIQKVNTEVIGNRKPSQFYLYLRSLAGNFVSEEKVREIWLRRLPLYCQKVLIQQCDLRIEQMIAIADSIYEVPELNENVTSKQKVALENLKEKVEELSKEIADLKMFIQSNRKSVSPGRGRSRSASQNRGCSRSRSKSSDKETTSVKESAPTRSVTPASEEATTRICWYHGLYGASAHKCLAPCSWKAEQPKVEE